MIGLLAAWGMAFSAVPARAQVNIDQGKSTAEIFSNDCGTCHKTAKGLANGNNSATLAGFLREHYTSSAQQAASLAAYVLGAGSGPPPSANLKPGTGEPKTGEAKAGEVRIGEPTKPGEKAGARPGRPEPSSTAKLQQPADQDTKIEAEPAAEPGPAAPGRKPAGKREPRPVTASRGPRQEPETPPPAPQAAPVATPDTAPDTAPVATAPATAPSAPESGVPTPEPPPAATAAVPSAAPEPGPAPSAPMSSPDAGASGSASAPAEAPPSDNAPVPRDDIPD
jgi:hypothetical protein